jgi:hypothetical protein
MCNVYRSLQNSSFGGESMKYTLWAAVLLAFGSLFAATPVLAHHSFSAEFDGDKEMVLTGVITSVDWINPHSYWHIDVTNKDGQVEHWMIQSLSPAGWHAAGIMRNMVGKVGDTVTVDVFLARDGTKHMAWSTKFTFSDGRSIAVTCPRGR